MKRIAGIALQLPQTRALAIWIVVALIISVISLNAGAVPVEEWNKTFGGIGSDEAKSVRQTSDGGYILVIKSQGANGFDAWLIKTDANGNQQWSKTFGGLSDDWVNSVQQTSDGGYILAGLTNSFGNGGTDAWLIKTDAYGNEQWSNTFGEKTNDYVYSVQQTLDGGYVLVGDQENPDGFNVGLLIKTDEKGNEVMRQSFLGAGGLNDAAVFSVQQTTDRGYILGGMTTFNSNIMKAWLIKKDANFKEEWSKTFGGTSKDVILSVWQTLDGGFVLAGATTSFGAGGIDAWLIKTDAYGNEQWSKTFGGTSNDYAYSVQQTSDGGYILGGWTESYGAGSSDAWIIKTDKNGNQQWNKTLGGTGSDKASTVRQTSDGGYILAGVTDSYGTGTVDAWLIKVSSENDTTVSTLTQQISNTTPMPNSGSLESSNLYKYAGLVGIVILIAMVVLRFRRKGHVKEPIKLENRDETVSKAVLNGVYIKAAFGYKGATIIYKVKIENNTSDPISDIKVYPYVPDVFLLNEKEKSVALIEPKSSQTLTFEIRPTGECGDCNISGRVNYYDMASRKRQDIELEPKSLSIVCPMLHGKEISEAEWHDAISNLVKTEESTKEIDMPAETLFTMISRIIKDMHMYMLKPEVDRNQKLFNGMARFYGEGVKGLRYAAQVEVVGGAKKSKLILKAWAEKEDALTGFYHGILDEIEKRVNVKGYIDDSIVQQYIHIGDKIGTQVKDSIVQRSTIGAGARKCPDCGKDVEANEKFCPECGARL